jgi:hypothetical protein
MGAHGIGLFDDDDGADFAAEILRSDDISLVAIALNSVPTEDCEYCDHGTGVRALLAAELIASQLGYPSEELEDGLQLWIEGHGSDAQRLVPAARNAVSRILRHSETRDLWKDSDKFYDWLSKTRDLASRLE